MKRRRLLAVILLSACCAIGAVWEFKHLRSRLQPWQTDSQLRLTGALLADDAVPVGTLILKLAVPAHSWVSKGQVIGETEAGENIDPAVGSVARARLAAADADVAAAREQLRAIESGDDDALTGATEKEYQMVAAEESAAEAEHIVQRGDRLLRQGMESELKYDEDIELRREAVQREDAQRIKAVESAGAIDALEAKRAEARATLRYATQRRRSALTAMRNLERSAGTLPVVSPADGYLVMRDEDAGACEIAPSLRRRVVTQVRQPELALVRVGQQATIVVDGQPETVLHAVVDSIGQAQQVAPGDAVFPVTLALTEPALIRPDSSRVTITLQSSSQ